jgi:isopenicillin-N N-acyltransferase like protein
VTAAPAIHLVHVSGSHREVGAQIGAACGDVLRQAVSFDAEIPDGRSRADQLALADRYREITASAHPWYLEEIEGAAESAGVDPLALFACATEEIWYEPRSHAIRGRCSDLVAAPPATADDRVLVGHNNDMPRKYQEQLVAIEWEVPGDPAVLTIGNGIWISVGWSSAGLSLTGNELSPNDERIGVPREVQVRAMLRQPTLDAMVGEALRHDRASSYNNVLASRDGRVVNVEGSAMAADLAEPDERGHLVHTNHYATERMARYEGDPEYAGHSAVRARRAAELLDSEEDGAITVERLRGMLSDHENPPDALCRHPERWGGDTATAFWCIANVTDMRITYGRGNPCDSVAQDFAFA